MCAYPFCLKKIFPKNRILFEEYFKQPDVPPAQRSVCMFAAGKRGSLYSTGVWYPSLYATTAVFYPYCSELVCFPGCKRMNDLFFIVSSSNYF